MVVFEWWGSLPGLDTSGGGTWPKKEVSRKLAEGEGEVHLTDT